MHFSKGQAFAWAVRSEMGYPLTPIINESVKFTGGAVADVALGMELAGLAQAMQRDILYCGWASVEDDAPAAYSLILREQDHVDLIDPVTFWAANETAPLLIVPTRRDGHVAVGPRGVLERRAGQPANMRRGEKLALRRIRAAAQPYLGLDNAEGTMWVPRGGAWQEPPGVPATVAVRFN